MTDEEFDVLDALLDKCPAADLPAWPANAVVLEIPCATSCAGGVSKTAGTTTEQEDA